ncbi:hypothetical protein B0T25DRAFT_306426 [Lasiosphaeria hispida]|uniref:Uncharacterized protein n=1 Tax=Lasiosphaeria hispida TaxID=260671 RepID=A0AAJ0H8M8_9PEZI|nr:hypothetical protein B0T25DRAFT_306426 [Lasiosphaeria hispida]
MRPGTARLFRSVRCRTGAFWTLNRRRPMTRGKVWGGGLVKGNRVQHVGRKSVIGNVTNVFKPARGSHRPDLGRQRVCLGGGAGCCLTGPAISPEEGRKGGCVRPRTVLAARCLLCKDGSSPYHFKSSRRSVTQRPYFCSDVWARVGSCLPSAESEAMPHISHCFLRNRNVCGSNCRQVALGPVPTPNSNSPGSMSRARCNATTAHTRGGRASFPPPLLVLSLFLEGACCWATLLLLILRTRGEDRSVGYQAE